MIGGGERQHGLSALKKQNLLSRIKVEYLREFTFVEQIERQWIL